MYKNISKVENPSLKAKDFTTVTAFQLSSLALQNWDKFLSCNWNSVLDRSHPKQSLLDPLPVKQNIKTHTTYKTERRGEEGGVGVGLASMQSNLIYAAESAMCYLLYMVQTKVQLNVCFNGLDQISNLTFSICTNRKSSQKGFVQPFLGLVRRPSFSSLSFKLIIS